MNAAKARARRMRSRIASTIAVSVGLAVAITASAAHANGRAPLTNGVFFRPGDLHSLYVRTTFGLLISHDDGCTFDWVCEGNIGYGGPFDPKYAIASDGAIFASTFNGLRVSRDGGCSFATATTDIWVDALDIGPTGEVWIATADGTKPNDILSSTDNGATFNSRGMQSPTIWWKSVKVAPTNPQRVYITGYQVAGTMPDGGSMMPTPHLLVSSDDGGHWTESALAGVVQGATPTPIIAAVDPANQDVVYVISLVANPPAGDRLYRSADGGTTFTEVLATTDPIRNVVVRDAQHVLVATQLGGTFQSTDAGMSFATLANPIQLDCVGQRADGVLIGCGANWQPGYAAVARSDDGGATWHKVWRFVELHGPLACPDGTAERDTCDLQQWPTLQTQFGTTGPACGAFASEGGIDAPATKPPVKKSGCCDASGDRAGALSALAWIAVIAAWLGLRRRAST